MLADAADKAIKCHGGAPIDIKALRLHVCQQPAKGLPVVLVEVPHAVGVPLMQPNGPSHIRVHAQGAIWGAPHVLQLRLQRHCQIIGCLCIQGRVPASMTADEWEALRIPAMP